MLSISAFRMLTIDHTKPIIVQLASSIQIELLKNLKNVEIELSPGLTGIMGANGCGKSTVLHALACSYAPLNDDETSYRFPQFFQPTTDALWRGSRFSLAYSQAIGGVEQAKEPITFFKELDRWSPRYEKRPPRYTKYISIRESVPELEALNLSSMVHYVKTKLDDPLMERVRETAGRVLNRQYSEIYSVAYKYGVRNSIAVKTGNTIYPAFSMSSGEQRVFRILHEVLKAPKYSLILVDEIDLFLHQEALLRLIEELVKECKTHHKQLVFTSHFPSVAKLYKNVLIATLHRTADRTISWEGYSPAALRTITGDFTALLQIFVEDDIAEAIIQQVAMELGVRQYISTICVGAASNAFSMASGLVLSAIDTENVAVFLDGDVLVTEEERNAIAKKVLTGTEQNIDVKRKQLCALIRYFSPYALQSPEQTLHRLIHSIEPKIVRGQTSNLLDTCLEVVNAAEKHGFVDDMLKRTGQKREVELFRIVELAAQATGWTAYTAQVREWLTTRAAQLNLDQKKAATSV